MDRATLRRLHEEWKREAQREHRAVPARGAMRVLPRWQDGREYGWDEAWNDFQPLAALKAAEQW